MASIEVGRVCVKTAGREAGENVQSLKSSTKTMLKLSEKLLKTEDVTLLT